jgi:hypothetical protein
MLYLIEIRDARGFLVDAVERQIWCDAPGNVQLGKARGWLRQTAELYMPHGDAEHVTRERGALTLSLFEYPVIFLGRGAMGDDRDNPTPVLMRGKPYTLTIHAK